MNIVNTQLGQHILSAQTTNYAGLCRSSFTTVMDTNGRPVPKFHPLTSLVRHVRQSQIDKPRSDECEVLLLLPAVPYVM